MGVHFIFRHISKPQQHFFRLELSKSEKLWLLACRELCASMLSRCNLFFFQQCKPCFHNASVFILPVFSPWVFPLEELTLKLHLDKVGQATAIKGTFGRISAAGWQSVDRGNGGLGKSLWCPRILLSFGIRWFRLTFFAFSFPYQAITNAPELNLGKNEFCEVVLNTSPPQSFYQPKVRLKDQCWKVASSWKKKSLYIELLIQA